MVNIILFHIHMYIVGDWDHLQFLVKRLTESNSTMEKRVCYHFMVVLKNVCRMDCGSAELILILIRIPILSQNEC